MWYVGLALLTNLRDETKSNVIVGIAILVYSLNVFCVVIDRRNSSLNVAQLACLLQMEVTELTCVVEYLGHPHLCIVVRFRRSNLLANRSTGPHLGRCGVDAIAFITRLGTGALIS